MGIKKETSGKKKTKKLSLSKQTVKDLGPKGKDVKAGFAIRPTGHCTFTACKNSL